MVTALDSLDRCIQERFATTGKALGFSRVAITVHKAHLFVPENESEADAVRRFGDARAQVVMYLASRRRPRRGPHGGPADPPPPVQGPVYVHPVPSDRRQLLPDGAERLMLFGGAIAPLQKEQVGPALPDGLRLNERAVESLAALWQRDSAAFELEGWKFVARPVRATAQTCLSCHNWRPRSATAARMAVGEGAEELFRLGDPIGAVLYGYRPQPNEPFAGVPSARE